MTTRDDCVKICTISKPLVFASFAKSDIRAVNYAVAVRASFGLLVTYS